MLDHIDLKVTDMNRSVDFYLKILAPLGYQLLSCDEWGVRLGDKTSYIWLGKGQPEPFHFAFQAENHAQVDQFYQLARANGGQDNGAPGYRETNYYACYIIDPDGYRIECVCHY